MATIPNEGTALSISDDGSAWTAIAQVIRIKPPGGKVPEVEKTVLSDTMKRFRPGKIPEAGEVTFTLQRDPNLAGHQTIAALLATPAVKYWKVEYVDGMSTKAKDVFQGFVTEADSNDAEDETNHEWDLTIRIDGAITRTAGS